MFFSAAAELPRIPADSSLSAALARIPAHSKRLLAFPLRCAELDSGDAPPLAVELCQDEGGCVRVGRGLP